MRTDQTLPKTYLWMVIVAGAILTFMAMRQWTAEDDAARFTSYLVIAILGSCLNIRAPGTSRSVSGAVAINVMFLLSGIALLGLPQTVTVGLLVTTVQFFWRPERQMTLFELAFALATRTISIAAANTAYWQISLLVDSPGQFLALAGAAGVLFAASTIPAAAMTSLREEGSIRAAWVGSHLVTLPYYFAGGCLSMLVQAASSSIGWTMALLISPLVYSAYRAGRAHAGESRAESESLSQIAG